MPQFSLNDQALNSISPIKRRGLKFVELLSGLTRLKRYYHEASKPSHDTRDFLDRALDVLGITYRYNRDELARIPVDGPVILVANHPTGVADGLVMASLMRSVRNDGRIMANEFLGVMPEMHEHLVCVDPMERPDSPWRNVAPLKQALRWLGAGHCLHMFPAGEVSALRLREGRISDRQWTHTIVRLAVRTNATVVPIFISGRASLLFQLSGLIHPRLRTALLAREFLNTVGSCFELRIGKPVSAQTLRELRDGEARTNFLRVRTYMMQARRKTRAEKKLEKRNIDKAQPVTECRMEPIVEPVPVEKMELELRGLPAFQTILDQRGQAVIYARAHQIPNTLKEIGRLREVSFRQVGEGTGNAIDLDRFDQTYTHLFIYDWNHHHVVGAYRIGATDDIIAAHGIQGLYTSTLFTISKKFFKAMGPALEMGRSFVRPECQKGFTPLMLLWKGIAGYVQRNPRYKTLFGPVSISDDYHDLSKALIMRFMSEEGMRSKLSPMVKPKSPPKHLTNLRTFDPLSLRASLQDIEDLSHLIQGVEGDEKGVPVLLRQYVKLGAQLLSFNVDAQFGDVLDGLVLTDLTRTDPKVLRWYMGKQGSQEFFRHHGVEHAPDEAKEALGA